MHSQANGGREPAVNSGIAKGRATANDNRGLTPPARLPSPDIQATSHRALVVAGGSAEAVDRHLAVEAPLALRVEGHPLATVWRTPGDDRDLAVGFLLTEGLIATADEIHDVRVGRSTPGRPAGTVDVRLADPARATDWEKHYRRVYSSCGLCGDVATEDLIGRIGALPPPPAPVPAGNVLRMARVLRERQAVFDRTGGAHGVALFEPGGQLLAVAEDIGRHNAVDKVVGRVATSGRRAAGLHLMVSGRISFEIVTKAARVGVALVAGVSAPTDLAVRVADALGMILVGFVRGETMTVYAGADHIAPSPV